MSKPDTDVAIIGAGPGGLSAALWCDELGLASIVFEAASEAGGQLLRTHNSIENYLGAKAANGRDLRDVFVRQFDERGLSLETGRTVTGFEPETLTIRFEDESSVTARAIIIATGVSRREPEIKGIERFSGKGLLDSGKKEKDLARDKVAVVVGGGDAALENALILSGTARKVFLVHRRETFRARPEFVSGVESVPLIEILVNSEVCGAGGEENLETVSVRNLKSGYVREISASVLIFRIGVTPNSGIFSDHLETDAAGYISVDDLCRTSMEGVYAVGDVSCPVSPTIATAAGMGATSAKSIFFWLSQSYDIQ